jgi:hypothetical protein
MRKNAATKPKTPTTAEYEVPRAPLVITFVEEDGSKTASITWTTEFEATRRSVFTALAGVLFPAPDTKTPSALTVAVRVWPFKVGMFWILGPLDTMSVE